MSTQAHQSSPRSSTSALTARVRNAGATARVGSSVGVTSGLGSSVGVTSGVGSPEFESSWSEPSLSLSEPWLSEPSLSLSEFSLFEPSLSLFEFSLSEFSFSLSELFDRSPEPV